MTERIHVGKGNGYAEPSRIDQVSAEDLRAAGFAAQGGDDGQASSVLTGAVSFLFRKVQPPAALYFGPDDKIHLRIWNSFAGLQVGFVARILQPNGNLAVLDQRVTPTSDRLINRFTLGLPEGWLLSCELAQVSSTPNRGQCYANASIGRGKTASQYDTGPAGQVSTGKLIAGYLQDDVALGFPGGRNVDTLEGAGFLRSVTGTDPAANTEITETVPTGTRWKLRGMHVQFVTDANVANRDIRFFVDDGAATIIITGSTVVQTASLTREYALAAHGQLGAFGTSKLFVPLPPDLILLEGWRIRTSTGSMQAGDNFGPPQLYVEEWINP